MAQRLLLTPVLLLCIGCTTSDAQTQTPPKPLPTLLPTACGHAHNDYLHARPLLDALDNGFCSVEVDVFLVGGELLVAHTQDELDPSKTLQGLYLDPLRERHQAGSLARPDGAPLGLLIDVKSEAGPTYAALHEVLAGYQDILTSFADGGATAGAVTAVISGNRDRTAMEGQALRHAAMDGRLADLGGGASPALIPLVSQSWFHDFIWMGDGTMPTEQRQQLTDFVARAHAEGRRLRFWNIPDQPNSWQQLLDAGVDLINTDDLEGFSSATAAP